jgi:hypothetical protein
MTGGMARIENGFAEVEAGSWLMGRGQPAAFFGKAVRHRRRGWRVCDRSSLDLVETTGVAKCADALRPFLTHIPCAAPISAVSGKVLLAPAGARLGAQLVRAVPMSARSALCITTFGQPDEGNETRDEEPSNFQTFKLSNISAWVVMATASRTCRMALAEDQTLSVRPEAVVAWSGKAPTGFCPKLSILDVILPRGPSDLLFTFYGPGIVWIEGASNPQLSNFQTFKLSHSRRYYGL